MHAVAMNCQAIENLSFSIDEYGTLRIADTTQFGTARHAAAFPKPRRHGVLGIPRFQGARVEARHEQARTVQMIEPASRPDMRRSFFSRNDDRRGNIPQ